MDPILFYFCKSDYCSNNELLVACFTQLMRKMETLYAEISDVLDVMEDKSISFGHELSNTSELLNHIMELKDLVKKERNDYIVSRKLRIVSLFISLQWTGKSWP